MGKLFETVKSIFSEVKEYHTETSESVFKLFVVTVLTQFAVLSLLNIETNGSFHAIDTLEKTFESARYWWGILGLYGAATLLFEKYIKSSLSLVISGYTASIVSLASLSYDFISTKPPVHTGGILAATAVVFLGGLLYGRVRYR